MVFAKISGLDGASRMCHAESAQPAPPRSGPNWAKSSLSYASGDCVEVADDLPGGFVGVRNSRDPLGPVLRFTRAEWDAFLGGVHRGEFGGPSVDG